MKDNENDKEKRKSFLPIYKKLRPWFRGAFLVLLIPVIVATLIEKKDESWLEIIRSLESGLTGLFILLILFFVFIEIIMSVYQYYLDRREERRRKIKEEIQKARDDEREKSQRKSERYEREINNQLSYRNWPTHMIEETIREIKKRVEENDE